MSNVSPGHVPHVPVVRQGRLETGSTATQRSHRRHRPRGLGRAPKKAVAGIPAGHLSNFIVMYKLGSIAAKLIYIVGYRKYIDGQV